MNHFIRQLFKERAFSFAVALLSVTLGVARPLLADSRASQTGAPPNSAAAAGNAAATQTAPSGGQKAPSPSASNQVGPPKAPASRTPAEEETDALDQAVNSAQRNPQTLIKNLEHFLDQYPRSPRREQVLRTIYRQALQANDPHTAETCAEALLEIHPNDPTLLSSLVDLLDRESDAASLARAVGYTTSFVDHAEKLSAGAKPPDVPEERWQEATALMRATAYLMRGKVYAKSGENDKAFADDEKSYSAYPTAQVAESLGDLAATKGDSDRALDYYVTAFAFPDKAVDPAHHEELRRKVGSAYVAKNKTEKGLGDLILARYDLLSRSLKSRYQSSGRPNAGINDPLQFVLQRLDGSAVRLADFHGQVLVVDFWATWCGPCRMEGKALERVLQALQNQPAAAFLAVNVDEERSGVPGFVKDEKWKIPVAYAQGLDRFLDVTALPTLLIFDRKGRVFFRQEGMDPATFEQLVESKVRAELTRPPASDSSQ